MTTIRHDGEEWCHLKQICQELLEDSLADLLEVPPTTTEAPTTVATTTTEAGSGA